MQFYLISIFCQLTDIIKADNIKMLIDRLCIYKYIAADAKLIKSIPLQIVLLEKFLFLSC